MFNNHNIGLWNVTEGIFSVCEAWEETPHRLKNSIKRIRFLTSTVASLSIFHHLKLVIPTTTVHFLSGGEKQPNFLFP